MAKLYAETHSDKDAKRVGKGGNQQVTTDFFCGNVKLMSVTILDTGSRVPHITVNDWRKNKS